ncbi:twin-arginine translocation pathway signal protein [Nitratireductor aquibiodomus RA22]|uniref:Twin-arginine translocation pathway signal protein n=1 Tax=Nitratireductor aquibiodomus RA22 TaxID=1189611 RepID=I5BST1_9HYPH|nr:ABC transporter substrate-binding protein [Nitratireductor aquibiodomus]EIM72633.1 twin-arginine translocation pathway signal protein [Nitratireductor aquibiodomus RA22]
MRTKLKRLKMALGVAGMMLLPATASAEGKLVPEIDFLTWPAAKYQHYYETSAYLAEAWEKLGLRVKLNPQPFPSPMLGMWFTEHKFDVVMSVLSGSSARFEPDFYSSNQFVTENSKPGGMNVGSFSNAKVDALTEKQRALYDIGARREVIFELQEAIQAEQPEALVAYVINTTAYNKETVEIDGYQSTPEGLRSVWNLLKMKPLDGDNRILLGWTIDQDSWNPLTFKTLEDLDRLGLVYDRLLVVGPSGKPEMWAAESMEAIDSTTFEVTLRDDLVFNDGKPLTADDVKFTFDYLKENKAVYFHQYLENLEEVTFDGRKIRFRLGEPSAPFVSAALGQVPILPKHVWSNILEETGLEKPQDFRNIQIVGSGPYNLKYWKEGREIYFERNEKHFMKPQADLLMVQFGSAEVLTSALAKGDIDISLQPLVPTVIDEFRQFDQLELVQAQSNGYMSARYNIQSEVFANADLRKALAHAIPFEAIIEEVLGGDAAPTPSSIVPSNTFWTNPDLTIPEYDIEKARSILGNAGFTWDGEGRLHFPE